MRPNGISHRTWWLVGLWACTIAVGPARGDEADDIIKQILSQAKTRAEGARKLLDSAKMLNDAPAVQTRMCEEAYEYGMLTPAGYATALEALKALDTVAPDRTGAWGEKRLEVYRQQYLRADRKNKPDQGRTYVESLLAQAKQCAEAAKWSDAAKYRRQAYNVARTVNLPERPAIFASLRNAENRTEAVARIEILKATITKNPADVASRRRLVESYLIALDMPQEAAKYLSDALDATLRSNVALAAKDAAELADADFVTLGQWYKDLVARAADNEAKTALLTRARDNLRMYLEVYPKQDVQRLKVVGMLKAVEADLARLNPPAPVETPPQWVDVLALVDPAVHPHEGEWARQKDGLYCSAQGVGLVSVPITAAGNYDLQLTFTLTEGMQCRTVLPIGSGQAALVLGGTTGSMSSLSMVDGRGTEAGNPSLVRAPSGQRTLRAGAKTTVDVEVRIDGANAQVTAKLNGKKHLAWTGKHASLTVHSAWPLPAKTFALATYKSKVLWHSLRLRRLDATDRKLTCVSRGATYAPSSVHRQYKAQTTLLTGRGKLTDGSFACHTARQNNPYLVVILPKEEMVQRIIITNRRGAYAKYTTGLAVELSTDGERWKPLWIAPAVRESWLIDLKTPLPARYVRISRPGTSSTYLVLAGVQVYAPTQ